MSTERNLDVKHSIRSLGSAPPVHSLITSGLTTRQLLSCFDKSCINCAKAPISLSKKSNSYEIPRNSARRTRRASGPWQLPVCGTRSFIEGILLLSYALAWFSASVSEDRNLP